MKLEKVNEVWYRVYGDSKELSYLKKDLSFFVPGAQYSNAYKNRVWDGKVSYLDCKNRSVPAGLIGLVSKCCTDWGFSFETDSEIKKDLKEDAPPDESFIPSLGLPVEPRDYQKEQFSEAIRKRRGVICSPTGSGKSLVIYMIVRWLLQNVEGKILIVVPSVSLVEQMWSDFSEYGWKEKSKFVEQLYSGKNPTYRKRVLLTTFQSIMRKERDFYDGYTVFMADEAHTVKSAQLMKIAKFCVNARYRLGFTGTIPTEPTDYCNVFGVLGRKIYDLKSKNLMEQGVLSGILVVNMFLDYPEQTRKRGRNRGYAEEVELIETLPERNQAFDYIFSNLPQGQNSLILVNHIKYLETLSEWLKSRFPEKYSVRIIQGATDPIVREGIRKNMENEKDIILVATYGTMSTGINIKKIHNIIFGSGSKSYIRVIQSIGRGLRLHETKDKLVLWDLIDDFRASSNTRSKANYALRHWNERYKMYTEQGFECLKKTLPILPTES